MDEESVFNPTGDIGAISHNHYSTEVSEMRNELFSFLCQKNLNPKEIILTGKLKAAKSSISKYKGVSQNSDRFY